MKLLTKSLLLSLVLIVSILFLAQATAKESHPEIGKPVPDFTLENIGNYKKRRMTSEDFKGRFVILDFWSKTCVSCIQSFPKLNAIHKKFKDQIDLILVGTDEEGIEGIFTTSKERLELDFAFTFNMPLYKSFVTIGVPHLVWIDDKGIIKAISSGRDLTTANIEAFLRNEDFTFSDQSHAKVESNKKDYNRSKPFLVNRNGGEEYESIFRYRSLITEYIPGTPLIDWPDIYLFRRRRASVGIPDGNRSIYETCASLKELYRMAYTGYVQWSYKDSIYSNVHGRIIFELSDSSLFNADRQNLTGLYWYSLVMPLEKATPAYVMERMQNDLRAYFGYYAKLETRRFPYLRVVASEKVKKLKTKGGKQELQSDYSMFKATNIPLDLFFRDMFNFHNFHNYWDPNGAVPVIINEAGISENVDIDVKVISANWQDLVRVLNDLGFSLVRAEKDFKVLVISDK
jgi:thiol-disulfide isomerase/thioredoxin